MFIQFFQDCFKTDSVSVKDRFSAYLEHLIQKET